MVNEYLIKKESLTKIADEVRELSGTSQPLGLDAMASNLVEANTEIDNQVELLAQAVAALEGKAGSNGVGANIQWHSLKSLPTSYAIEDDFNTTYYMELPSRYCWILFSDQLQIGCYDVFNDKDSQNLSSIHQGTRPSIIEESGVIYLQLTTAITDDLYYAIVEISPIA